MPEDHSWLEQQWHAYMTEMVEHCADLEHDREPDGRFHAEITNEWWLPTRDGVRGGFAVVEPAADLDPKAGDLEISELFVIPEFRGRGLGSWAIEAIIDRHHVRRWELFVYKRNRVSVALVERVLTRLPGEAAGPHSVEYRHCAAAYYIYDRLR